MPRYGLVDEYRVTTNASIDDAARALGRAWQSGFLRARLGRAVEVGEDAYLLRFLGNSIAVSLTAAPGATRVHAVVQESRSDYALYPLFDRLMHVDSLSGRVFRDGLCRELRDRGYTAAIETVSVVAPG